MVCVVKRKDELEYMECGCTEESLLHCLQSAPVLLPLICMLIHQPTIQPSPNKPKTMPLPWTQISQTIVLCVLECKCMNPVAAACSTLRVNIQYHTSMQKCAAEVWVWVDTSRVLPNNTRGCRLAWLRTMLAPLGPKNVNGLRGTDRSYLLRSH